MTTLDEQVRYASLLAESSLIPRHLRGNPANVLLYLALADAQEVKPAVAFNAFSVIGDTPSMKPEFMRAQISRHGHTLDYEVMTDEVCRLTGTRGDNGASLTVEWTLDTALRAGLDPKKGTWAKYPKAMLSARATAELARALFADCLNGISYTPEELGADVEEDGTLTAAAAHQAAMDRQATVPPASTGRVERKRGEQPPDDFAVRSDPAALNEWIQLVHGCQDKEALTAAWTDLTVLVTCGQIVEADREACVAAWSKRRDEVVHSPEGAVDPSPSGEWPPTAQPGSGAAA